MKKILILDGYNLIYRAKFSRFNLNRDKSDTSDLSIVYTFVRAIRALVNEHAPDKVYFVLEGRPVQRLATMESYKANRVHERDEGFSVQRRIIKSIVNIWPGLEVIHHPDHECDDVIAALAKRHKIIHDDIIIVSSDTDFFQLMPFVRIWNPVKREFVQPPVPAERYVEWKALKGDVSDNIIGFNNIGAGRAIKLLESAEILNDFLSKPGYREKFEQNIKMINFESVELANCIIAHTLVNNESLNTFKMAMLEFGFDSIAGTQKKWEKFIKPFIGI